MLTAGGHRVVAECEDGTSVLAAFLRTRPDVLMLTSSVSGAAMEEARALGVAGWLRKDDPPSLLPSRVRTVAEGLFLLGDARADSVDSRVFGAVPSGDVVRVVPGRVWPAPGALPSTSC